MLTFEFAILLFGFVLSLFCSWFPFFFSPLPSFGLFVYFQTLYYFFFVQLAVFFLSFLIVALGFKVYIFYLTSLLSCDVIQQNIEQKNVIIVYFQFFPLGLCIIKNFISSQVVHCIGKCSYLFWCSSFMQIQPSIWDHLFCLRDFYITSYCTASLLIHSFFFFFSSPKGYLSHICF